MADILSAAQVRFDDNVGVLVIGAGACGLTAALAAAERTDDILVLERDAAPQGSTALSSGFVPAAGTRYQTPGDMSVKNRKLYLKEPRFSLAGTRAKCLLQKTILRLILRAQVLPSGFFEQCGDSGATNSVCRLLPGTAKLGLQFSGRERSVLPAQCPRLRLPHWLFMGGSAENLS